MFDSPDEYQTPDQGDRLKLTEHAGRLVAIRVDNYKPDQQARGATKPAVGCVVTIIDGPNAGHVYTDALIFGAVIVPQLREKVGRHVLGRLRLGEERDGNNAPVILDPANEQETEYAVRMMTGAAAPAQQPPAAAAQPAATPAPVAAAGGAPRAPWEQ